MQSLRLSTVCFIYVYGYLSRFFRPAKERFKDRPGVRYEVLDISQDPLTQGFELKSFDLIIAANVVHATPSLNITLLYLYCLLRAGG
jgi:hypothetical protein